MHHEMERTPGGIQLQDTRDIQNTPRSVRQKHVLDVAEAHPDASIEWIADQVPSGDAKFVESVLETYGDPAREPAKTDAEPAGQTTAVSDGGTHDSKPNAEADGGRAVSGPSVEEPSGTGTDDPAIEPNGASRGDVGETDASITSSDAEPDADPDPMPSRAELTETQRETLATIRNHPEATQRELAERLGVSAPTINNRVNTIPGFEWEQRRQFVAAIFDPEGSQRTATDDAVTDRSETNKNRNGTAAAAATTNTREKTTVESDPDTESNDRETNSEGDVPDSEPTATAVADEEPAGELTALVEELATLNDRLERVLDETGSADDGNAPRIEDPELAHKVIRVCIEAEQISEEEELEIIEQFV